MNDDFNTPLALGHLSDVARLANVLIRKKRKTPGRGRTLKHIHDTLATIGNVVGVMNRDPQQLLDELRALAINRQEIDVEAVDALVRERTAAREARDWAAADSARDKLLESGIELMDGPQGTTWRPAIGSN